MLKTHKSITQIIFCALVQKKHTSTVHQVYIMNIMFIFSSDGSYTRLYTVTGADCRLCGTFLYVCCMCVSSFPPGSSACWRGMNSGSVRSEWGWVNSHHKPGRPAAVWMHKATVLLCLLWDEAANQISEGFVIFYSETLHFMQHS